MCPSWDLGDAFFLLLAIKLRLSLSLTSPSLSEHTCAIDRISGLEYELTWWHGVNRRELCLFPPRSCHPVITTPQNPTQLVLETAGVAQWAQKAGNLVNIHKWKAWKEATHVPFTLLVIEHTCVTFHVFFLSRVSRALQLICVIAPSKHTNTRTREHTEIKPVRAHLCPLNSHWVWQNTSLRSTECTLGAWHPDNLEQDYCWRNSQGFCQWCI